MVLGGTSEMAGTILKVGIKYILRRNSTGGIIFYSLKIKTNDLHLAPCAASTHALPLVICHPSSLSSIVCRRHHHHPPSLSPGQCLIVVFVCRSCRVVRLLPPAARPPSVVCAMAPHRRRRRDPLLARLLFDCCVFRRCSSVARCPIFLPGGFIWRRGAVGRHIERDGGGGRGDIHVL